ncbi:hypothetical protein BST61_g6085 [Cercospora zeina]
MSTYGSDPKCAACGESPLRPTLICGDCDEGVDINGRKEVTPYCTTLCRQLDRAEHHKHCARANRRKQVYRAGKLLQRSFYLYRSNTWDFKLARVKKREGILHMYDNKYNAQDDVFFDSPMERIADPQDQAKMLTYCACTDVWMHFHDLCAKLLHGISREIEEVDILLDIAGAQFGQYEPVLSLEAFLRSYHAPIFDMVDKFGTAHGKITGTLLQCLTTPQSDGRAQVLQAKVMEGFNELVCHWERKRALSMTQMTDLPHRRFKILLRDFVSITYDAMPNVMLKLKADGSGALNIRKILMSLKRTEPLPTISTLTLNNKGEGSQTHELWVLQQKVRLKLLQPMAWERTYEPQLARGANVLVPIRPGGHGM